MVNARQAWVDMDASTRLNVVSGRVSNIQNRLYDMHLNDLEGLESNKEERDRLTVALEALKTERDAVQAEIDSKKEA